MILAPSVTTMSQQSDAPNDSALPEAYAMSPTRPGMRTINALHTEIARLTEARDALVAGLTYAES